MFVFDFKLGDKNFIKGFIIIIAILAIIAIVLSFIKIALKGKDKNKFDEYIEINSNEYSNFLKDCHSNIDNYVGKKFTIVGYIYRMPDFKDNQFVLARTMLLNSNSKAVVVGILSTNNSIPSYNDNTWVRCKGIIEKGNYKGDMPVFNVVSIEKCETPNNSFISPPTD